MCRSRRELSNEYLLAKFGFDTAENEPCKICPLSVYRSPRYECTDSTDDMWSITYEGEPLYNTGNRAERKNKLPPKEWGRGQLAANGTAPVPSVSYITDFRMWSAVTWSSEVGPQPQTGSSPILALIEQIT